MIGFRNKNEKSKGIELEKSLDLEINLESKPNQYTDKNNFQLRALGRGISFNGYYIQIFQVMFLMLSLQMKIIY